MDNVQRLREDVSKLNVAITAETEQQKTLVAELRAAINDGSGSDLAAIADDLEASIDRVKAIVPDDAPAATSSAPPADTPPAPADPGTTAPSSTPSTDPTNGSATTGG